MDKKTRNILIGAGVLALLFFISRRNKKKTTGTALPSSSSDKASDSKQDVEEGGTTTVDLDEINKDANFSNANGSFTYQLTSSPSQGGSASLSGSLLTYTPSRDFVGTETVNYKIVDSDGASSNIATITFNVTPVYDGAPAKNITQTVTEDGSVTFDIATSSDSGTGTSSGGSTSTGGGRDSSSADNLVSGDRATSSNKGG